LGRFTEGETGMGASAGAHERGSDPASDLTREGFSDRAGLRERLERERDRLKRRLTRYRSDLAMHRQRVSQRDPCAIFSPAAATEDAEQEVRSRMAAEAEGELAAVDRALRRLEEAPDRVGRCERCDGAISIARLDLLPHTTLCQRCAQAADRA
jgi:RNA polymerase-binding transcription factor DksA